MTLESRLREKGWSDEEIERTLSILKRAEVNKPKQMMFLDKVVFWFGLFLAMLGNFFVAVALIPIFLAVGSPQLYAVLAVVGLAFGSLFEILLRDIHRLSEHDQIMSGVFMAAIAIISIYIMVRIAMHIEGALGLDTMLLHPVPVSAVYLVSFMAPYVIFKLLERRVKRHHQ